MNRKLKIAALLLAALLTACGGSEKAEPPQLYVVGEDSLPSLNALVTLNEGYEFQQTAGDDGTVTYVYSGLADGAGTAGRYADALEQQEGCRVGADVASGGTADFSVSSGQAVAANSATDPEQMLVLTIRWEESTCSVTAELAQAADLAWARPASVTLEEAMAYMEGLSPSYLGLTGSMDDYNIIPQEGTVMLDDKPCLCVNVYLASTHQFQQSYLLTVPGLQVYRLDRQTGEAAPLG